MTFGMGFTNFIVKEKKRQGGFYHVITFSCMNACSKCDIMHIHLPVLLCDLRLGLVFSVPLPFRFCPLPFLPALVFPLNTRPFWVLLHIHLRFLSALIDGWLASTTITSYHLCFPSWPTQ